MTEQPTTPPPAGRTPTLGRGVCWSAHPDFDGPIPPAEPWQPPARRRPPGGWPKEGRLGASTQLVDDEHPVTVPACPYADVQSDRVGQALATADTDADDEPTWVVYLFGRAIGWFRR